MRNGQVVAHFAFKETSLPHRDAGVTHIVHPKNGRKMGSQVLAPIPCHSAVLHR